MYSSDSIVESGCRVEPSTLSPREELVPTNRNELEIIEAMYHNWSREWRPPNSDEDDSNGFISDDNELNVSAYEEQNTSALGDQDKVLQDLVTDQQQLKIIRQPESQHRARYLSEGSRGAIKDRSGKSHCTIQLIGVNRPTKVEIFAGNDSEPNTPHPLYRLIAVTGKGGSAVTTPCQEIVSEDGLNCIEVTLHPTKRMTAVLDCVGVLKICSHDVKKRVPKAVRGSTIKLIFRARVADRQDPTKLRLLTAVSDSISCVQHLGYPEIHRASLTTSAPTGGAECFLIGKNFQKNSAIFFREHNEEGRLVWTSEATVDRKYLSQCHMICSIPTYRDLNISSEVQVDVTVECENKRSPPFIFTYKPTGRRHSDRNSPTTAFHSIKTSPGPSCSTTIQWQQPTVQPVTTNHYPIYPPQHQQQMINSCAPLTPTGVEQNVFNFPSLNNPAMDLNQTLAFQPLAQQPSLQPPMAPSVDNNCYAVLGTNDSGEPNIKQSRTDYDYPQNDMPTNSRW